MVICGDWIQPLNLECLFINTLVGSADLAVFVGILIISFGAAFFRMSGLTLGVIYLIFFLMMREMLGTLAEGVLLIIIILIGIVVFRIFGRMFKN